MATHLHSIIHSAHPEAEEDELSDLAMAVGESEAARKELAQHFNDTPAEECIIMSILHNGSDDACGFVCWALHALAADEELRSSLVSPAVATGLRDALVRAPCRGAPPRSVRATHRPWYLTLGLCVPKPFFRSNTARRCSGPCSACSSSSQSSRRARMCSLGAPACGRP